MVEEKITTILVATVGSMGTAVTGKVLVALSDKVSVVGHSRGPETPSWQLNAGWPASASLRVDLASARFEIRDVWVGKSADDARRTRSQEEVMLKHLPSLVPIRLTSIRLHQFLCSKYRLHRYLA